MATSGFNNVDEYIATFPDAMQDVLRTVRRVIREAIPDAEEVIGYQMPAYRRGRTFLYFGGFKRHYSLFCPDAQTLAEAFKEELSGYEVSKGTIKFPLDQPVPVKLIRRIAKHRAAEYRAREKPMRRSASKR